MGSNQRLHKIETSLTPQQAILLWIKEAHSHPTLESYAKWLSENPETRSPFRFGEKAIDAIEKSASRQKQHDTRQIVSQAMQEYEFLYHLFLDTNVHFHTTAREKSLWSQLLLERIKIFKGVEAEIDMEDVSYWKELFLGFYAETYIESATLKLLSQKHYSGNGLLFQDLVFQMECRLRLGHFLHETFNDFCHDRSDITPIDLTTFESGLHTHINQKLKAMTALARAEVLVKWGRREDGVALVEKHLFSPAV